MPLQIDLSSIDLNVNGSGFTANYLPVLSIDEPSNCQLPSLIPGNFNLPTVPLTSVNAGCQYAFTTVFPTPPPFVPKPIPPICPSGGNFSGTVSLIGTGALTISNNTFSLSGGPCNATLTGGPMILNVPVNPCPEGSSFSGQALITTSGIASGGGSINVTGGPCGFALNGFVNINVPPPNSGGGGGGSGGDDCVDCMSPPTCDPITSAIETIANSLGRPPVFGDLYDLCVYTYICVLNTLTSTCPGDIDVVPFNYNGGGSYVAKLVYSKCTTPSTVPYNAYDVSSGGTAMIAITPGTTAGYATTGSPLTVSGTGNIYIQTSYSYDSSGAITVSSSTYQQTSGTVPSSSLSQINQTLCNFDTSTTPITINNFLQGSQNFNVCGNTFQGPYGV